MIEILRVTDWTNGYTGRSRVLVLAECPHCKNEEAHAVEFEGETPKCWICLKEVEAVAGPTVITVFAERREHVKDCVKCAYASSTGGNRCPLGYEFRERIHAHESRRQTPWLVRRERSFPTGYVEVRHTACWDEKHARAQASRQGGEVIDQTHLFVVA